MRWIRWSPWKIDRVSNRTENPTLSLELYRDSLEPFRTVFLNHFAALGRAKTMGASWELIKALFTITLLQVLGGCWERSVKQAWSTRTEAKTEISILSLTRVENSPVRENYINEVLFFTKIFYFNQNAISMFTILCYVDMLHLKNFPQKISLKYRKKLRFDK